MENKRLAPSVYRMELSGDTSQITAPGQFVNIRLEGKFLRRPISVCDKAEDRLVLIYKVVGHGTEQLSAMQPDETLDLLTGLGNGYDLAKCGGKPLLIGGGAGVPPMYWLCRELIAMGVYFRYNRYLHAHLSGTRTAYLSYSPAAILKYALALYGHENGYQYIHYGGGSTKSPDNGLYKYKKEFGKNTSFDFYIGKKVWNERAYVDMCKAKGVDMASGFFPAYRQTRS